MGNDTSSTTHTSARIASRRHIAEHKEPRSAAEITTSFAEDHPDRTTLEGLVAKNQAQRTKKGASVFDTRYRHHTAGRLPRRPNPARRKS